MSDSKSRSVKTNAEFASTAANDDVKYQNVRIVIVVLSWTRLFVLGFEGGSHKKIFCCN